ncbi:MAG: biotin--[acetyl-CoA-carboxylase] ligase [Balneolales bacterium]|nr:biotin--[acetyl-CoA-carboxylase] ligase [Balneolales bacterium]
MDLKTEKTANWFNSQSYYQNLNTKYLGHELLAFHELASTNALFKNLNRECASHGMVCLTESQLKGVGQRNRVWESEAGKSLTFSCLLKPKDTDRLQLLLQAAAFAVAQVLKKEFNINTQIKWPNDLLAGGKKLCGILAEGVFVGQHLSHFIIGIGLNVNNSFKDADTVENSISLLQILGKKIELLPLICSVLSEIEMVYERFEQSDKTLVTDINRVHRGYGLWNTLVVEGNELEEPAKFLGLDLKGYPVFLSNSDDVLRFTTSEVRFKPI